MALKKGNKIELTVEQKDLLNIGTVLSTGKKNYYYFPFWIEEDTENKEFIILNWDNLPEKLKKNLKELRDE